MSSPFLNDLAQRILTLNKHSQRKELSGILEKFIGNDNNDNLNVLDFGCGTGLFSPLFTKLNCRYTGFEIDDELVRFARRKYPKACFSTSKASIEKKGAYDVILAQFCFHHIDDSSADIELQWLRSLLKGDGDFIFVDLLIDPLKKSRLHQLYMKLEQGKYVKTKERNIEIIERCFHIKHYYTTREVVFSISPTNNPFGNDVIYLICKKRN